MRIADETNLFRMKIHKVNKYWYASTQRPREDDKSDSSDKKHYVHFHWGKLDEHLVFEPYPVFLHLSPEEQSKFIFPEDWDLTTYKKLSQSPQEKPTLDSSITAVETGLIKEYSNRFYGGVWLLEKIAYDLGIREDLMSVFNNTVCVNDVMTIAMFMILTNYNLDRLEDWQDLEKYPSTHRLSPPVITEFEKSISHQNRLDFFKCRSSRIDDEEVLAIDSTTRTSYDGKLVKVAWGKNKEGLNLPVVLCITLYSVKQHIPVFSTTVMGNMNDSRSIEMIIAETEEAGFRNYILMMDRAYPSLKNLDIFIAKDMKTIQCMKAGTGYALKKIRELLPIDHTPSGFTYSRTLDLYVAQFDIPERTVKLDDGTEKKSDRLKLNLYYDPVKRAQVLKKLDIGQEDCRKSFDEMIEKQNSLYWNEKAALEEENDIYDFEWSTIRVPIEECKGIEIPDESHKRGPKTKYVDKYILKGYKVDITAFQNARATAGFRAIITHKLDFSAEQAMFHYGLRSDQEVDHELWKSQMPCDRMRNSSDSASIGADLIQFVSRIIRCKLRYEWSKNLEFRKNFRSVLAVLDTMRKIQIHELPEQSKYVLDPFGVKQQSICKYLNLEVPKGCETK